MIDIGQIVSGIGGIIGGGGIVAWRKNKVDAGKLALDIAKRADAKADAVGHKLDRLQSRVRAHSPWDIEAAQAIRSLGGTISTPPPLWDE